MPRADTIAIITHNMQQAARVSQRAPAIRPGRLVGQGNLRALFVLQRYQISQADITGRRG
jgi:phosphate transport system ATP-binding protein